MPTTRQETFANEDEDFDGVSQPPDVQALQETVANLTCTQMVTLQAEELSQIAGQHANFHAFQLQAQTMPMTHQPAKALNPLSTMPKTMTMTMTDQLRASLQKHSDGTMECPSR